ncbi:recombination-associated protein RdgC [Xenophilus sp. AP218F]|nr:recombination-associated protein RdgC [Xenophilus sp. AP218F]
MWFRQLSFYRLSPQPSAEALNEALQPRPFKPCAGLDWFSQGWVAPASHHEALAYTLRGYTLFALQREDKVLPAASINDAVNAKVAAIEADELRKLGRKERLALKEQITDDLLPRALTRLSRQHGYLDAKRGLIMVALSGSAKAEGVLSALREALPPLPALLPRTRIAAHTAMTDWLAAGAAPGGFELDSDALLKDSGENGAVIRCSRQDLSAEEIRQHIATGKQVAELGLIWNERIRFILTDELRFKRIQFLDLLQEEASQAGDDRESLFEATFLLGCEELGKLVDALVQALGGWESEGEPKQASPILFIDAQERT